MTMRSCVACALLVGPVLAACAGGGNATGPSAPKGTPLTVSSTQPDPGTLGFPVNWTVSAHFGQDLDTASPASAFTLKQGSTPVEGTVTYEGADATFTPAAELDTSLSYTATISAAVEGADGGALSTPYTWSFTTGDCEQFLHVDSFPLGPQAPTDVFSEAMTTDGTNIYLFVEPASAAEPVLLTIDPKARAVTSSITIPFLSQHDRDFTVRRGIADIIDIAWYDGGLWASGEYVVQPGEGGMGVFEVDLSTGLPEHEISLPPEGTNPNDIHWGVQGLANDGTNFYVSLYRYGLYDSTIVAKFDPANAVQIPVSSPFEVSPVNIDQMDFGGGFLWPLTEEDPRRIDKVDPNTGKTLSKICVNQDGGNILYFNGDFWSASGSEMKILELK